MSRLALSGPRMLHLACAMSVLCLGALAQAPRTAVPAAGQDPLPARPPLLDPDRQHCVEVPAQGPFQGPITDDLPDFAPPKAVEALEGEAARPLPAVDPYVLAFRNGSFRPDPGVDPALAARAP
ncbi:MAG: hypothetical protein R3F30_05640 [Planctomycetota bacterium]